MAAEIRLLQRSAQQSSNFHPTRKRGNAHASLPLSATPNPLFMPTCEQPSYSHYTPLPTTSHPSTSRVSPSNTETPSFIMTLWDTILGVKSRTQDRATRVDSGDFNANGDRDVEIEDPTVYKVYKRRWIGVAIIMLLNIVSSWRYLLSRFSFTLSPIS